jgi:Putative phage serine protease XkdF
MPTLTLPDGAVYQTGDASPAPEKWDGVTVESAVLKADSAKRYTLSVGYPADTPDKAVARDGHLDFANAEEVEKAAWGYLRNYREVGAMHADGTEGAGELVESYIYRGPDWQTGDQVVKSGDWLIGVIWDEPTWDAIQKGELGGTSMQGGAERRTPTPADIARIKANKRG